eukprot:TRINITY_DN5108_c0_g2_i2.p3 TRINITY_DN5108_c0_g2~~TRINITY_DN5108_c0_g2_i2.p3  ORF type:complete len:130 (+),score=11.68 TRINITY_DN5108_c0_g2_i2:32-391(+)
MEVQNGDNITPLNKPVANSSGSNNNTTSNSTFSVKIKRWHAVGKWCWDTNDSICGICHSPFDGCAPECKYPGDDCPVVWGQCGHAFHLQCIQAWLNNSSTQEHSCPLCRRPWEYQQADR